MPVIRINPRWGAQIEGLAEDIAELEWALSNSSQFEDDFTIARIEEVPILVSTRWDDIETAPEVEARARSALTLLVGAVNLLYGSRSLNVGTIYEFHPDGRFTMSRMTTFELLVKQQKNKRPSATKFRNVVDLSEEQEWLSSCLTLLGGPKSWFEAYMVIEAIEDYCGSEQKMRASKIFDGAKLKKAKQMANSMRHLDNKKHQPPSTKIELEEVWTVLKSSINSIINQM